MTAPLTDHEILAERGEKNRVDPHLPYAFLNEQEHAPSGEVEDVATIFLTNRECPFRCLMCDLWKNTTDYTVAAGDIPHQISHALGRLSPASTIKLYNSGNFFDRKAIPRKDYAPIANLVAPFGRVVVENHPRLCNADCLAFRDMLAGRLEVAMGLETVHEEVLRRLNKRMTLKDFEDAVTFLRNHEIDVRAFILLRPPFLDEAQGITWALRSLTFAFDIGVHCCSIIPTRAGNGAMDRLVSKGLFNSPSLSSIEYVLEAGLRMKRGRVFMDLWDLERFYTCDVCGPKRKKRLQSMNLTQRVMESIYCHCGENHRI